MMFILMIFKDDNIIEILKIINDYRVLSKSKGEKKFAENYFLSKKIGTRKILIPLKAMLIRHIIILN